MEDDSARRRGCWSGCPRSIGGRPHPERRRGLLLSCAVFMIALTGGTVYGWPAMRVMLLREASIQPASCRRNETGTTGEAGTAGNSDTGCSERELIFGLVYTIGSWSNQGGRLPAGILLDYSGPRVTATVSALVIAAGALIYGLATTSVAGLVCGYLLLGLGGSGLQISVQSTAALFPLHRSLAMSCMSGAYQFATGVFIVFEAIHRPTSSAPDDAPPRLSLSWLMIIYAMIGGVLAILSIAIWPDSPFKLLPLGQLPIAHADAISLGEKEEHRGDPQMRGGTGEKTEVETVFDCASKGDSALAGGRDTGGEGWGKSGGQKPALRAVSGSDGGDAGLSREGSGCSEASSGASDKVPLSPSRKEVHARKEGSALKQGGAHSEGGARKERNTRMEVYACKEGDAHSEGGARNEDGSSQEGGARMNVYARKEGGAAAGSLGLLRTRSFKAQVASMEFRLMLAWFSINMLQCQYTVGTVGLQFELKGDDDRSVTSFFGTALSLAFVVALPSLPPIPSPFPSAGDDDRSVTSFFGTALSLAFVVAPCVGAAIDVFGFGIVMAINTLALLLTNVLLLFSPLAVAYPASLIYSAGRVSLWATFFSYCGAVFGFVHYGKVVGILMLLASCFSLLQYPLLDLALSAPGSAPAEGQPSGGTEPSADFTIPNALFIGLAAASLLAIPRLARAPGAKLERRERKKASQRWGL